MLYNYSIIKDFVLKHKRVITIGSAVLFLVCLFLAKKTNVFERTVTFVKGGNRAELTYGDATVADLVNKDSDGDGVLDWEEPLWGLDPTKKETTPGTPDSTVIAKLKAESGYNLDASSGTAVQPEEKLTKTDKFSRELFSSVAALNQNGAMDQTTAENISASLADKIKNSVPRKVYTISDVIVAKNDLFTTIKNYSDNLNNAYKKYPINGSVLDVLQKFIVDENSVDASVLKELDPIIKQTQSLIGEIVKISVPQSIIPLHLDLLNGMERVLENIKDISLYESDAIIALGGISKYEENTALLESAITNLAGEIKKRLSN